MKFIENCILNKEQRKEIARGLRVKLARLGRIRRQAGFDPAEIITTNFIKRGCLIQNGLLPVPFL